jgi:hypothetical protein
MVMKTQEHRLEDPQRNRIEADLEATIDALFDRFPTLVAFSVQDGESLAREGIAPQHESDLFLTEVSVYPWSGQEAPAALCVEIVTALTELVDEWPAALELLHERTFARVLH